MDKFCGQSLRIENTGGEKEKLFYPCVRDTTNYAILDLYKKIFIIEFLSVARTCSSE